MKKSKFLATAVAAMVLLSSCKTRLVDFTIISTKNIDLSKAATFKRTNNRIEGESKAHIIVIIPTGVPNIKTAIDKAIESTKGAVALTDGVVYSKMFSVVLYGYTAYVVEGNALIDPALAAETGSKPADTFAKVKVNRKGETVSTEKISEAEFNATKSKMEKSVTKSTVTVQEAK